MARHARRGRSAPRLEVLEPRTLLSGAVPGSVPTVVLDPSSIPAELRTAGARPDSEPLSGVVSARSGAGIKAEAFTPDDPGFGLEWGLDNAGKVDINAPQAWSRTQG